LVLQAGDRTGARAAFLTSDVYDIVTGGLLISRALAGSVLRRAPLTASMFYLAVGAALGPWGAGLLHVNAVEDALVVERLTEIAKTGSVDASSAPSNTAAPIGRPRAATANAAMPAMVSTIASAASRIGARQR
jgi:sodium/hydrogen antiporter